MNTEKSFWNRDKHLHRITLTIYRQLVQWRKFEKVEPSYKVWWGIISKDSTLRVLKSHNGSSQIWHEKIRFGRKIINSSHAEDIILAKKTELS